MKRSNTRWRVGIVGLGRAVNAPGHSDGKAVLRHPAAVAGHPSLELVAAFDPDEQASRDFSRHWGAAAARTWHELVDHRLDCLLIAAPTAVHAQYLADAIATDIPVIVCEKPLTDDPSTARHVIAAYKKAQRTLHVFYPRRWISELEAVRLRMANGELGPLRGFTAYYGGGLRNIGCHVIELVLRLLGPIERAQARSSGYGAHDDPAPHLWLRLDSGVEGVMYAYQYSDYAMLEFDMLFQDGRIRLADLGFRLEHWHVVASSRYAGYRELALDRVENTDYGEAVRRFWMYVRDRGLAPTVDDWELAIMDVVHAGLQSLQSGRSVDVRSGD